MPSVRHNSPRRYSLRGKGVRKLLGVASFGLEIHTEKGMGDWTVQSLRATSLRQQQKHVLDTTQFGHYTSKTLRHDMYTKACEPRENLTTELPKFFIEPMTNRRLSGRRRLSHQLS
mmetsp:Transcript_73160/g.152716  ORF Transcript_73160/g.152716 Transcript_73160/m.152716 type:complete len:116 (+) Transcript_73160:182-529(+)